MEVKQKLEEQLKKIEALNDEQAGSAKFEVWNIQTAELLNKCSELSPKLIDTFTKIPLTQSYIVELRAKISAGFKNI